MIESKIETISPARAKSMLADNADNQRNLKPQQIEYLAGQMAAGKWKPQSNPIQLTKSGKLINGQHRLHAIQKYGKPVRNLVLRGHNEDDFEVIDSGIATRNAENHAQIEGREMSNALVPVMRWLHNNSITGVPTVIPPARRRISEYELQRWGYENHYPGLKEAYNDVKSMGNCDFINKRPLTYSYYLAKQVDEELAYTWFSYIVSGADPLNASHINVRESIISTVLDMRRQGNGGRAVHEAVMRLLAKGWWLERNGYVKRKIRLDSKHDPDVGYSFE